MAENKKSFLLYADLIHTVKHLPNDKAGELFKHLLSYVNDEDPTTNDIVVKLSFEPIKQQLKRDLDKWQGIRSKRSDAGKASAQKRAEQKATNPTSVKSVKQKPTNPTVNVNDNVSVSVNVSDTVTDNDIKIKVYSQAIQDSYKRILVNFPTQLQPKNKKTQNEWLDTLEKLERIDKIPLQEVEKIVKATRQDEFWAKNFMSLTKLRKKNPDNLPYIVVFNEKINKNGQQNGSTETRTPNERAREIFLKRRQQQNNAS